MKTSNRSHGVAGETGSSPSSSSVELMATKGTDGRRRMPANVLTSWGALLVQIVSGFVIPRLIDGRLGQHTLGVWDFSWSIVAYFRLVQAGITSSINRYVARYDSVGDIDGVNRTVSSVTAVLVCMAAAIALMATACSFGLLTLFRVKLGDDLTMARWTVLLLGMSMAVQTSMSGFGGVLTGLHRWDLHNAIYALSNLVTLLAMLCALVSGTGLVGLAGACLLGEIVGWGMRWILSYRVCRGLRVRMQYFRSETAREMLAFGGKAFLPHIGGLLLHGSVSIMVAGSLGPAALALFSRPRALVTHARTFVNKYAHVISPIASSLDGMGERQQVRQLLTDATRFAACLCLPIVLTMVTMGREIMDVWMGQAYRQVGVLAALSIGYLPYLAYQPLLQGMVGLNLHGRPGLAIFVAQCAALLLSCGAVFASNTGLIGLAVAVGLPIFIVSNFFLPAYACRELGMPVRRFLARTWLTPILCCAPYEVVLLASKVWFAHSPVSALLLGVTVGMALLATCYWKWALPETLKRRAISFLTRRRAPS